MGGHKPSYVTLIYHAIANTSNVLYTYEHWIVKKKKNFFQRRSLQYTNTLLYQVVLCVRA